MAEKFMVENSMTEKSGIDAWGEKFAHPNQRKLINSSLEGTFDCPRPYPNQMYSVSTVPAIPKARRMHARFSFSFAHVSTCRISYTNLKIIELDFGFGFLSF